MLSLGEAHADKPLGISRARRCRLPIIFAH